LSRDTTVSLDYVSKYYVLSLNKLLIVCVCVCVCVCARARARACARACVCVCVDYFSIEYSI